MAASALQICNSALAKLGAELISDLSDETKSAQLCNEQYAKLRDEVLISHPWNFAIGRKALAVSVTPPAFEYSYDFPLSSDVLRVLLIDGQTTESDYVIEGRSILTNEPACKIKYIKQVTDTTIFSKHFEEVLAWRIAWDLAFAITQSNTVVESMRQGYLFSLSQARSFDAQEGGKIRQIEADYFLNTRW